MMLEHRKYFDDNIITAATRQPFSLEESLEILAILENIYSFTISSYLSSIKYQVILNPKITHNNAASIITTNCQIILVLSKSQDVVDHQIDK